MLPNANHSPPKTSQFATYELVPLPVVCDFGIPKFLIAAGAFIALWAAVPKASVHEHDNPLAPEGEIWFAKKRLVAPPAGDAVLAKDPDQAQLRCFVSARTDQRHDFRPFLLAPDVGHGESALCRCQYCIERNGEWCS